MNIWDKQRELYLRAAIISLKSRGKYGMQDFNWPDPSFDEQIATAVLNETELKIISLENKYVKDGNK